MRRTNNAILKSAADELAGDLVDEIFSSLKDLGITVGLKARKVIYERIEKRIDELDLNANGKDGGE